MNIIIEKIISFVLFTSTLVLNFLLNFALPKELVDLTLIKNITNPQQVLWKNEKSIIFVIDGDIWEYIVDEDEAKKIGGRKENEFVGLDEDGELIFCEIEHFTISSYDEFSTKFTVRLKSEEKELSFFETIRPIFFNGEKIIAITAMDFLQEHIYEIDVKSGIMQEIAEPKKKGFKLNIPEYIDFKTAYIWDEDNYVIEDLFGNVYVRTEIPYITNLD